MLQRRRLRPRPRRGDAGLCRHVPFDRRAAAARICVAARARSAIHHPRSRGFGDLMNWARHAAGLSRPARPVPDQGDLPLDLFARRQFAAPTRGDARRGIFPGRRRTRKRCASCSRAMSRPSSASACSITTTSCSISRRCSPSPKSPPRSRPLRSSAGRRIPGHQPAAGRDRAGAAARRARAHGGRRRRAVDLFVSRRDGAQHSRLSAELFDRRRASSRSSATIARRSRSSPRPTP